MTWRVVLSQFVVDFGVVDQKSAACKQSDLDTLFLEIDAQAAKAHLANLKQEEEASKRKARQSTSPTRHSGSVSRAPSRRTAKFDDKRQRLSRVEFMTALVHIAIRKYATPKKLWPADAMRCLLEETIIPRLRRVHTPPSDFRLRHLYGKEVARVLTAHLVSLRTMFEGLVTRGQQREARSYRLLHVAEWLAFLRAAGMVGGDLSERDATLAFAWSRMCVADERTELGAVQAECLPFDGFVEVLCRISALKATPSDAELGKAKNAAEYLESLRVSDAEAYSALLKERARPFGCEPAQPLDRCMHHLMSMLIRAISGAGAREVSAADMKAMPLSNEEKQAASQQKG